MKYNIFYSDGGSSGPFVDIYAARKYAGQFLGGFPIGNSCVVEIRPNNSNSIGGYAPKNKGSEYISNKTIALDNLRDSAHKAKLAGLPVEDILRILLD